MSVLPGRERRKNTFANLCPVFRQIGRGQKAFLVCFSIAFSSKYSLHKSGIFYSFLIKRERACLAHCLWTTASPRVMLPVKTVERRNASRKENNKHRVVHFMLMGMMISSHQLNLEGEVTLSKNMHKSLGNHKSPDWFIRVWREQVRKITRFGEVAPE